MAMALEKEKLQKIIVIGSSTIMVSALYYNLVINMIQTKAISEFKTKINEIQTRLDKGKENEKRWKQLSASGKEDDPFLVAQESKLMKGDHVAWLWSEMGDFADKQKMNRVAVVPEGVGPNGLPDSESYEPAGASLNLTCGYHKLGDFVQNLENAYPTLQLQHVEILGGATASADAETVRLQFQLLAMREEKVTEPEKKEKVARLQKKKE